MTGNTVLRVELDVPVECRFTKADSFNGRPTYPIPPATTIRGLCYAAMNRPSLLNQDSKPYDTSKEMVDKEREFREEFEEKTEISVQPKGNPREHIQTDLRNRMKVGRGDDDAQYITYVVQEQSIISPVYIAYITADDDQLLSDIESSLEDPGRMLYLGHSDDIVTVSVTREEYTSVDETPEQIYAPVNDDENVEDPLLLPIHSDYKARYTTRPAESRLIGLQSEIPAKKITHDNQKEYFEFF